MSSITPIPKAGEVKDAVRDLFTTKKYSDLGIYCRGQFWDVHQAVVCMRSTVLETFCVKAGRQSQGKLHIDLSDYESEIISSVIEFAYLDQYEYSGDEGLVFHTKMFIAASKFDMLGLQQMAVAKYRTAVDEPRADGFEKRFCNAAGLLWAQLRVGEGEVLKGVVVGVARTCVVMLLMSEGGEFRKLGLESPAIAMAVLEAVVGVKREGVAMIVGDVAEVVQGTPGSSVPGTDVEEMGVTVSKDTPPTGAFEEWMNWSQAKVPEAPKDIALEAPKIPDPWDFSLPPKSKKDKKKSKLSMEVLEEPIYEGKSQELELELRPEIELEPTPLPVSEPDGWGILGKSKKKKGRTCFIEEPPKPEEPAALAPEEYDVWGFSANFAKKDKKKKKKTYADGLDLEEPASLEF